MGPLLGATELSKALIDAGNNLLKPHSSTVVILSLLDEIESLLSTVEQDPTVSVQNALIPSMKALVSANLLRNPDSDVRVFVVSCLTEIMRITAPEAPYNDDQMKEIFQATIEAFDKLADASCRSYKKAEVILETVSKVRSSLVMLDLECDDLVLEMFRQFLKIISPDHPQVVLLSMETIMITVIDESEEVSTDLLDILLTAVKEKSHDVSPMASRLVERVLSSCAHKLQPYIIEALKFQGTNLDMYPLVVSTICQVEVATTQAQNVVNFKENEADEKISEKQVIQNDSEDKLEAGLSRKGNRSKRTARVGTRPVNGDDKARTGNNLNQLVKQEQFESTNAETESGSTRKRGRKPNSLMNPEEGYSFKTSSSNKMQEKELEDSSHGKLAAKKASLPTKVGQTNQSVVISLSPSSKARTGSRKRSRTKMEETNNDECSIATSTSNKPEEEDIKESILEKPEDSIKTAKSNKKERTKNGSVKTSAKKSPAETKMVKTSGKKSVHSDAKKKNSEGASMDTPIPQSSKSKKKNSSATTPSTTKSKQTPKSHPKRKRTAGEEVESNTDDHGEELVGKKVNVWWPLDKKFYEGVIDSYCPLKKLHRVSYSDGEVEELNLKTERFEIIQDTSACKDKEIDLMESIPLSDLIQMQKGKKSKNLPKNVEPSSSPEVRSSIRTTKKKDSAKDKQANRTKGAVKAVSNEPESKEGKTVKSLKEVNGRTKGRTGKKQKVTQAMHFENGKDCDEKQDPETKGENSVELVKPNAETDCMVEYQELSENQNAETKTDGKDQQFAKEPNGETKTDGEEPTSEPKTDEEEHKVAKDTNVKPEADEEVPKSLKKTNVEPKTEPDAESETKETYTSMSETGKEENEAEEDNQRVEKELKEESLV